MNGLKNRLLGIRITWLSIVLNIFLFAIKYWAGIITGSVALIADAWHTLSDSVSSLAVLIGLKVAHKPADDEHPFGHGRAELIASIVVGILLAIVGFNFLVESFMKFQKHEIVVFGQLAIYVTIASILIKEFMAQYSIIIGKKLDSSSMVADGWHHRSDAISSAIILVGIFLGNHFWWMDAVLGILVSLMIFYTTFSILKETISVLLGERISDDLKKKIICLSAKVTKEKINPHNILMHKYGHHTEITLHISLPGFYSLKEAHDIATRYEKLIAKKFKVSATIHIDSIE